MSVRKYPPAKCKICGARVGLTYLARHLNGHTQDEKQREERERMLDELGTSTGTGGPSDS